MRLRLPVILRSSSGATRVGEHWARGRATRISAFMLGRLTMSASADWQAVLVSVRLGLSGGAQRQWCGVRSWAGGSDGQ